MSLFVDKTEDQPKSDSSYEHEASEDSQDTTFEASPSEDSDFLPEEEEEEELIVSVQTPVKDMSLDLNSEVKSNIPEFLIAKPVDLDRKLPLRLKRPEYEPKETGVLLNISQPIFLEHYDGQKALHSKRHWTDYDTFMTKFEDPIESKVQFLDLYSNWFQWRKIHDMETLAFPLFCGRDASETNRNVYIHIRDSMIEAYHSLPQSYLSITECYHHLCYDVYDIISIHQFLERFRMINHQVTGPLVPKTIASFHFEDFRQKDRIQSDPIYVDLEPKTPLLNHCFSCQSNLLLQSHYVCRKYAEFQLCVACFAEGRFPSNVPSSFFKFNQGFPSASTHSHSIWTEQETLSLLESLESLEEWDWERVSARVASKNAHECLMQFLSLPILESLKDEKKHPIWETLVGHAPNPLMSLLMTFVLATSPALGAESAIAALQCIASKALTESGDIMRDISKESLQKILGEATEKAWDAGVQYASERVLQERQRIHGMVSKLTELRIKLVEWKLGVLEELLNQSQR